MSAGIYDRGEDRIVSGLPLMPEALHHDRQGLTDKLRGSAAAEIKETS